MSLFKVRFYSKEFRVNIISDCPFFFYEFTGYLKVYLGVNKILSQILSQIF